MKYQVCRALTPIEYAALKADIAENGILVPIEVDETGEILDGHHRVQAWQQLRSEGVELPAYAKLTRYGLTEEQKRNHARKLNLLRRQMTDEERKQLLADILREGGTLEDAAQAIGVDTKTVWNTVNKPTLENSKVERPPKVKGKDGKLRKTTYAKRRPKPPTLFHPGEAVALDPKAAEETAKQNRQEKAEQRRDERVDKINEIAQGNKPLDADLDRLYPVIYADPPWRYEHSVTDSRKIENQYPTMSLEEICALPVGQVAAPDAIVFLWTPPPKVEEALQVLDAWGFVYRTSLVWDKIRIGMGYYARQQHELLLVATRGEIPPPEPANRPSSVIQIRRDEEHSAKPHEFYNIIERMYPEFDKLELFARNQRDGWTAWGNQIESEDL